MHRRHFLAAIAAAPLAGAPNRIDLSRVAVLTDEVARTPADAFAFCRQYGLRWLELRGVPGGGGHYGSLEEPKLREFVAQMKDHGLKVSFLNTPFFKITLPGTEPVFRKPETPEARAKRLARHQHDFDNRKEQFAVAFRNAHILGVDKMRVFTFLRIAEPETVFQQTADVIGEMSKLADKEGIKLVVENEGACNVLTSAEIASFMKLMPKSVGVNWDPTNAAGREKPFPDGYALLPKQRIWNMQFKGRTLLEPERKLPWAEILAAMAKDGYKGNVGLETHYLDGTDPEKSHLAIKEIIRLVAS